MFSPLTKVLLKTVAVGFYKMHTGLILTSFLLVFINFFFTPVLNQTHLTPDQIVLNNLKLVLSSVSDPLATLLLGTIWLLYSAKSWQFVSRYLQQTDAQFLFYSSNALHSIAQFRAWFVVQFVISGPIVVVGAFTILIGLVFGYYRVPLLIPVYVLALVGGSALHYTRLVNRAPRADKPVRAERLWLTRSWPKPYWSLFLYEILYHKKLIYGLTKGVSAGVIAFIWALFAPRPADIRIAQVISLGVALTHAVLVYQWAEFDRVYLRFGRNFPLSQPRLQLYLGLLGWLLLLPEVSWLLIVNEAYTGLSSSLLLVSTLLLFRLLVDRLDHRMDRYLRAVFGVFVGFLLAVLFGAGGWLIGFNLLMVVVIVYRYGYPSLDG